MKVGIINVTGYAGIELARILHGHPEAELVSVTGRSAGGQKLGEAFPHLSDIDLTITEELEGSIDLAFSGLPHKASAEVVAPLIEQGLKVIDISADFRLKSVQEYEEWYGVTHPAPVLIEDAVYGLTELHRSEIASTQLVANPGCYPTSAILALAPAVKAGLIEEDIVVDSKSGVSGAGRGTTLFTHFSEVNENVQAYSLDGHRHLPEITQELHQVNLEFNPSVTFLTHLIPMTRGILSSCYAKLKEGSLPDGEEGRRELRSIYEDYYRNEPFIRLPNDPPFTKHTLGNNYCAVYPTTDIRTNKLIVVSCLDNLVKGAAGQAIQNMNLMFGLPESLGLGDLPLYP